MRRLVTLAAGCVAALAVASTLAGPLRADHPLVGTWIITLPDGSCHETYWIRSDGTALATSAEEISESAIEISDRPSPKGFYKWVDRITKDNGKKDCSGEVTQIGQSATNYIRLDASGDMFVLCEEEDLDTCIGPFVRMKGTDI